MLEVEMDQKGQAGHNPIFFGEDPTEVGEERTKYLWSAIGQGLLQNSVAVQKKRPYLLQVIDARNNYVSRINK